MEEILPGYLNKTKGEMNVTENGIRENRLMTCGYSVDYDFGLFLIKRRLKYGIVDYVTSIIF